MLALYFVVVLALPLALGSYVALHGLHRSRQCPACSEDTVPVRSRSRRLASRALRSTQLQRRWCMTCGWEGTARVARVHPPRMAPPRRPVAEREPARADQVDIRRLEIDGRRWKVMVKCWAEGGRWMGRLLFVGPDGRSCLDESSSLEGDSALEVLSSAMSIPERALAGRIRRAIH